MILEDIAEKKHRSKEKPKTEEKLGSTTLPEGDTLKEVRGMRKERAKRQGGRREMEKAKPAQRSQGSSQDPILRESVLRASTVVTGCVGMMVVRSQEGMSQLYLTR